LDVTQKTAWFLLQRIRLVMQDECAAAKSAGRVEVEIDETQLGGGIAFFPYERYRRTE